MKTALIVYSGGLDTTICIPLMREEGFERIVTVTIDVGQPAEDVAQAAERAKILGTEHHVVDAKAEFAADYCFEAIRFNADYFGYPLSTSIARPLIAQKAAEVGIRSNIDAFVHGCTGKGNDQFRLEHGIRMFAPGIPILAPVRERNLTRTWEIEYAERVGAPIGQSREKIWSIDENLWGRSIEGGRLEDPTYAPPEEIFAWTSDPAKAPDEAEQVEFEFADGRPVAIGGRSLEPMPLIQEANRLAGKHGVGRIDIMEDRMIGLKVRENYECPGATLLIAAHRALEALVASHAEREFKAHVDQRWADLAYKGLWWEPLKGDLLAFASHMSGRVTGKVVLRLFKGSLQVVSRSSPFALYSEAAASFDDTQALDPSLMTGMVRVHGMESELFRRL